MDNSWQTAVAQQFGAAIDMLEKVLVACPDELWRVRLWNDPQLPRSAEFWYVVYHTLFWLDLYLSGSVEGFMPPAPFTLDELDPAGIIPERAFSRDELQTYLAHGREKCRSTLSGLTDERRSSFVLFRGENSRLPRSCWIICAMFRSMWPN
ncbi:MAG: DinB family protein [Chloroflexi bacterium]|nr:DinB family protein [Chloroflexota bacterium]